MRMPSVAIQIQPYIHIYTHTPLHPLHTTAKMKQYIRLPSHRVGSFTAEKNNIKWDGDRFGKVI